MVENLQSEFTSREKWSLSSTKKTLMIYLYVSEIPLQFMSGCFSYQFIFIHKLAIASNNSTSPAVI